jgi:predicted nucleic acid-binding protein
MYLIDTNIFLENKKEFRLDFDDVYQYGVAKAHGLQLVTMDLHFRNIKDDNNIIFI